MYFQTFACFFLLSVSVMQLSSASNLELWVLRVLENLKESGLNRVGDCLVGYINVSFLAISPKLIPGDEPVYVHGSLFIDYHYRLEVLVKGIAPSESELKTFRVDTNFQGAIEIRVENFQTEVPDEVVSDGLQFENPDDAQTTILSYFRDEVLKQRNKAIGVKGKSLELVGIAEKGEYLYAQYRFSDSNLIYYTTFIYKIELNPSTAKIVNDE